MAIRTYVQILERMKCVIFIIAVACIAIYYLPMRFRIQIYEKPVFKYGFTPDGESIERQQILAQYLADNTSADFDGFYEAIVTEVVCPKLQRVGSRGDGGKMTCDPSSLPENCVIYSLGVGGDISFEVHIDKIANQRCKMYSFDPNERFGIRLNAMKSERFIFLPYEIAAKTDDAKKKYTVQDLMKKLKHELIDFFKIDIEGHEFEMLPSLLISKSEPVACQLFIEMHGSPSETGRLLQKISRAGYYLFTKEVNPGYPQYCEFSFIHENCLKRHGVDSLISRNFI